MRSGVLGEEQVPLQYRSTASMQRTLGAWRPQDVIDIAKSGSEDNVEILRSEHNPTHGHRESLVIFNYNDNTTIDSNRLRSKERRVGKEGGHTCRSRWSQ